MKLTIIAFKTQKLLTLMEFFGTIGYVVTVNGIEETACKARMYSSGGMNEVISVICIVVIPSFPMNVLQKLLRDAYPEYISKIPDEIERLRDNNN